MVFSRERKREREREKGENEWKKERKPLLRLQSITHILCLAVVWGKLCMLKEIIQSHHDL